MRIRFNGANFPYKMEALVKTKATKIQAELDDILIEVLNESADEMQHYIETRETDSEWRRNQVNHGPGRIDTGKMYNAVDVEIINTATGVMGRFGWIEPEDYYLYQ